MISIKTRIRAISIGGTNSERLWFLLNIISLSSLLYGIHFAPFFVARFWQVTIKGQAAQLLSTRVSVSDIFEGQIRTSLPLAIIFCGCMILIPIATRIENLRRSDKGYMLPIPDFVKEWSLMPILLLSLIVVVCKDSSRIAVGTGFWWLFASEVIFYGPLFKSLFEHGKGFLNATTTSSSTKFHSAIPEVATEHKFALIVTYVSLILLILGVSQEFISTKKGVVTPYTLLGSIRSLYDDGNWKLAGLLLIFSVVFPFSKTISLLWLLNFRSIVPKSYLRILARLGPWSMLDAVVAVIVGSALGAASLNNIQMFLGGGYWCFIVAIVLNAIGVNFVAIEHQPCRR